ncbi:MAG: Uma2 family endonuclease [Thiothrix sp.]|nr:Uma2 family endonuclease [Thiothrix sp.]HPE61856.1 Uma2 family endonuclease [Thiolinea sp.]
MAARKWETVADWLRAVAVNERVELINGEIVQRPMARFAHARVQSGLSDEVSPFRRCKGEGGWWIVTEISVRYSEHHCPTHDLAGWRRQHMPEPPSGVVAVRPDWVCEITSPGHESKDLVMHLMRLQRYQVPYYWVISPESKTLIAYELAGENYRVIFSCECTAPGDCRQLFIPPFDAQGIDLGYVFGGE